jgi:hypothetical protein
MVGGTSVKVLAMLGWLLELKHLELCSQGLLIPASALEVGGGRRRAHWGNGGWSTQGLAISGPAIRTRGQGLSICGLSLATCLAHRLLDGPSLPMPSSLGRLANGPVSGVLDTAGWRRSRGGGGATTAGPAAGIPGAGAAPGTVAAAPVALPTTLAPPGGSPKEEPGAPCCCGEGAPDGGAPVEFPLPPVEPERWVVAGVALAMVSSSI